MRQLITCPVLWHVRFINMDGAHAVKGGERGREEGTELGLGLSLCLANDDCARAVLHMFHVISAIVVAVLPCCCGCCCKRVRYAWQLHQQQ